MKAPSISCRNTYLISAHLVNTPSLDQSSSSLDVSSHPSFKFGSAGQSSILCDSLCHAPSDLLQPPHPSPPALSTPSGLLAYNSTFDQNVSLASNCTWHLAVPHVRCTVSAPWDDDRQPPTLIQKRSETVWLSSHPASALQLPPAGCLRGLWKWLTTRPGVRFYAGWFGGLGCPVLAPTYGRSRRAP